MSSSPSNHDHDPKPHPLINPNPSLHRYYTSLEAKLGYWLLLGNTRHFGYYPKGTTSPFPISKALRAMEDHLAASLLLNTPNKVLSPNNTNVTPSSPPRTTIQILDAGCGHAHVSIHLALTHIQPPPTTLHILAIDILEPHLRAARANILTAGLSQTISVRKMDYHHLDGISDGSLDGVFTMETFVHATDLEKALGEFYRVLRPGGRVVMYEYDHVDFNTETGTSGGPWGWKRNRMEEVKRKAAVINKYGSLPANGIFERGFLQRMLEEGGFEEVAVRDLTENIAPMLLFFYVLAYVPYLFVRLFGLERRFVSTMAGVEAYRAYRVGIWRYVAVTARKPGVGSTGGDGGWEGKKMR